MKGILGLLRHMGRSAPGEDKPDSMVFTTAFAGVGHDAGLLYNGWAKDKQAYLRDQDDLVSTHLAQATNPIIPLARKLSLRLRVVSARLSDQK